MGRERDAGDTYFVGGKGDRGGRGGTPGRGSKGSQGGMGEDGEQDLCYLVPSTFYVFLSFERHFEDRW